MHDADMNLTCCQYTYYLRIDPVTGPSHLPIITSVSGDIALHHLSLHASVYSHLAFTLRYGPLALQEARHFA
jgi:hypothetical protein